MRRVGRGEVVKVGDLFSKYKQKLRAPQKVVIQCFIEVIEDIFEYTIPENQVRYSVASGTLKLTTNSQLKTEILLQKEVILKHMKQ